MGTSKIAFGNIFTHILDLPFKRSQHAFDFRFVRHQPLREYFGCVIDPPGRFCAFENASEQDGFGSVEVEDCAYLPVFLLCKRKRGKVLVYSCLFYSGREVKRHTS